MQAFGGMKEHNLDKMYLSIDMTMQCVAILQHVSSKDAFHFHTGRQRSITLVHVLYEIIEWKPHTPKSFSVPMARTKGFVSLFDVLLVHPVPYVCVSARGTCTGKKVSPSFQATIVRRVGDASDTHPHIQCFVYTNLRQHHQLHSPVVSSDHRVNQSYELTVNNAIHTRKLGGPKKKTDNLGNAPRTHGNSESSIAYRFQDDKVLVGTVTEGTGAAGDVLDADHSFRGSKSLLPCAAAIHATLSSYL